MLKAYIKKLSMRVLILISIIFIYFFTPNTMDLIFSKKLYDKLIYLYIIWGIFMTDMITLLIPKLQKYNTIGSLKHHKNLYIPDNSAYTEDEKANFVKKSNSGALKVLISWLALSSIIGALYFSKVIDQKMLLLISTFFYVCDLVCIVIWCPFHTFMMKNKCCVNCRIFNWGYTMMFTPLVFIKSFFSWSLVIMSLIITLKWEITWYKHPERFWHRTNCALQCKNCQDKICKIKIANRGVLIQNKHYSSKSDS